MTTTFLIDNKFEWKQNQQQFHFNDSLFKKIIKWGLCCWYTLRIQLHTFSNADKIIANIVQLYVETFSLLEV